MENNIEPETGRKNQNQSEDELEITILSNGDVILPDSHEYMLEIAKSLGDQEAIKFLEQSNMTEVLIGKKRCG